MGKLLSPYGEIWYTDGAKNGNSVGIGIHGCRGRVNRYYALRSHVSIFQAKLTAILECARCIARDLDETRRHDIYICTDSMAAVRALSRVRMKTSLTSICAAELNQLGERCNLIYGGYQGTLESEATE